jgi:hypothetical protein
LSIYTPNYISIHAPIASVPFSDRSMICEFAQSEAEERKFNK